MRITTPAAQLAAQSASPCSAYKRARSICQCVVKFSGSASSRREGRGVEEGEAWHAAGQKRLPKSFASSQTFLHILPTKRKLPFTSPSTSSTSSSPSTSSSSSFSSCAYFLHVSLRFGFHFSFRFLVSFLLNALIAIYQIGK